MTTDSHDVGALGAYALGVIAGGDRRILEEHLSGCSRCRQDLTEIQRAADALSEAPPEMLMDGPPEGADLVLQTTLRTVRTERKKQIARRRARWGAWVAAAVIVAATGGVVVGQLQERDAPITSPPAASGSAQPTGLRIGSYKDPQTGAAMRVALTPAAGWVRINAAVTGIPAGQRCRLWVVARDGTRQLAGSWLVSPKGAQEGTTLDGSAIVDPADVLAIEVDNFQGGTFVSVSV